MNQKWDKFYKDNGRFYLLPHPELKNLIKLLKDLGFYKVLDIGCGSGNNLIKLAEEGFDVTGIDYSVVGAHLAEEHLKKKNLMGKVYTGDYQKSLKHFSPKSFDSVISINSLQYITETEIFNNIISEISNLIMPKGVLFLVVPSNKTIIIEPNLEQMYWQEDKLKKIISDHFDIKHSYIDSNKSIVILATNK